MERFNYPNLAAVYEEDASILQLLEAESYGVKADQREALEAAEVEARAMSDHG